MTKEGFVFTGASVKELSKGLAACRYSIVALAICSALINVLYLSGSIYMLEIYDRVIPSRSIPTLVGLSIILILLFVFQATLEILRGRVLVRIGGYLSERVGGRVFDEVSKIALISKEDGVTQPLRDLDQVRGFVSSPGPVALLDLPWIPFYVGICFFFHPALGVTASVGAVALVGVTALTEVSIRAPARAASAIAMKRNSVAEAARRNAEVLQAMGMVHRFRRRWQQSNSTLREVQQRTSDVVGDFGAISKVLRMSLQSAMLAVGAYLVVKQEATSGIIIAGSIIAGRALAPIDLAIAHWRNLLAARESWSRLGKIVVSASNEEVQISLPAPKSSFAVEGVVIVPPGAGRVVVSDISFKLRSGNGLGIIGPSGSGKSCLLRSLVGAWKPARGAIRIDGGSLNQWTAESLGQHLGYLPQDIELFAGSVADNISRFDRDRDWEAVISASRAAGVHELILKLPNGYRTEIGEGGVVLSAGQRQRIGLARALYRDPFLVILDEPNSNLDAEGDEALTRAILAVRSRGGIVIVVAHRASAISGVDLLMIMSEGKMRVFGPKKEVLTKLAMDQAPSHGLRGVHQPTEAER